MVEDKAWLTPLPPPYAPLVLSQAAPGAPSCPHPQAAGVVVPLDRDIL